MNAFAMVERCAEAQFRSLDPVRKQYLNECVALGGQPLGITIQSVEYDTPIWTVEYPIGGTRYLHLMSVKTPRCIDEGVSVNAR